MIILNCCFLKLMAFVLSVKYFEEFHFSGSFQNVNILIF
jgi:hypothetical protein